MNITIVLVATMCNIKPSGVFIYSSIFYFSQWKNEVDEGLPGKNFLSKFNCQKKTSKLNFNAINMLQMSLKTTTLKHFQRASISKFSGDEGILPAPSRFAPHSKLCSAIPVPTSNINATPIGA